VSLSLNSAQGSYRSFQSGNYNFPDLIETIALPHRRQNWYTIS